MVRWPSGTPGHRAVTGLQGAEVEIAEYLPDEAGEMAIGKQGLQSPLPVNDDRPARDQEARHA